MKICLSYDFTVIITYSVVCNVYRGPTDLNQFRHKITKPQKLEKYTLILPLIPPKQKKKLTGRRVNEEKTSLYPT